jgi:hypothetical protein
MRNSERAEKTTATTAGESGVFEWVVPSFLEWLQRTSPVEQSFEALPNGLTLIDQYTLRRRCTTEALSTG